MITLAKIYSPNKDYNGISANVLFVNGIGECDTPYIIKWFKEHGYFVEEEIPEIPEKKENVSEDETETENKIEDKETKNNESTDNEQIDFDDISFQDLKKYAAEKGINTYKMKKANIIKELEALQRLEG